jgi:hypothetical protein
MSDDLSRMTPEQIRRLIRAKSGPPKQRLNAATQAAIDATLTRDNLRSKTANEKAQPNDFNVDDYFRFGG